MKRGMKTRFLLFMMSILLVFGMIGTSYAILISDTDMVIDNRDTIDTSDDTYWIQDISMFTDMDYQELIDYIDSLSIGGLSWRLATSQEVEDLRTYHIMESNFWALADAFDGVWDALGNNQWEYLRGRFDYPDNSGGHYYTEWYVSYMSTLPSSTAAHEIDYVSISDDLAPWDIGAWVVGEPAEGLPHEPVPEPATMLLLGSGLVGLAGFRRKKFKK